MNITPPPLYPSPYSPPNHVIPHNSEEGLTVTVALLVVEFPLLSVTVNTTVLDPVEQQSKVLGTTLILSIPQLSVEPLSICSAVILAWPLSSN